MLMDGGTTNHSLGHGTSGTTGSPSGTSNRSDIKAIIPDNTTSRCGIRANAPCSTIRPPGQIGRVPGSQTATSEEAGSSDSGIPRRGASTR